MLLQVVGPRKVAIAAGELAAERLLARVAANVPLEVLAALEGAVAPLKLAPEHTAASDARGPPLQPARRAGQDAAVVVAKREAARARGAVRRGSTSGRDRDDLSDDNDSPSGGSCARHSRTQTI